MRGWMIEAMVVLFLVAASGPAEADPPELPDPHVYIAPTAGIVTWDDATAGNLDLKNGSGLLYGGRIGYSPFEALAAEIVLLTGDNEVAPPAGTTPGFDPAIRLTLVELSFVVNFRSLLVSRWYPFVNLGAGAALRSGEVVSDGERLFDGGRFAFHLGGGVKVDLARLATLRFNLRDTFYTETRTIGGQEIQDTLDAVEISGALEYRFPLGKRHGPARLR